MKRISKVLVLIIWIMTIVLSFYIGMTYQWASTAKIDFAKDFNEIVVEEKDVADYSIFTEIPEKYGALKQIPEPIRKTISLYMQANDLKLSEGTHHFDRIDGTLDEYLNEQIKFEPIK